MDQRIVRHAERQHGVVTRQQLLGSGFPPDTIREIVRSRRLRRVSYGVYTVPGAPATPRQELMIAQLRCGPGAVVVGEPTLAMVNIREAASDGPFVVLTRPERRPTGVPWRWRHDPLPDADRTATIDGIRSLRTDHQLLEIAVDAGDRLEPLVDGVRWSRHGIRGVERLVSQFPEHPGAAALAGSGLIGVGAGDSPPEREMAGAFAFLGAQTQVEVLPGITVDVLLPQSRIVLEYQGKGPHGAPDRRRLDADKRRRLTQHGYLVIEVTSDDLRDLPSLIARVATAAAARVTA